MLFVAVVVLSRKHEKTRSSRPSLLMSTARTPVAPVVTICTSAVRFHPLAEPQNRVLLTM